MRRLALSLVILLSTPCAAFAQRENAPTTVTFEGAKWRVAAQEARVERHLGRDALALARGRLWRDGVDFADGVVEFDVAYQEEMVFIGAAWRAESDDRFEEMYFRGHLNNKPDALQYTPVEHGLSAWQIFSDANAIAPVSQRFGAWNNVKIVVEGGRADIYFNSEAPVLHVPDLKTGLERGLVGLRHSGAGAGPAYFSNIAVRPLRPGEGIVGAPKDPPALPEGVIGRWSVSAPFAEAAVAGALALPPDAGRDLKWSALDIETNGIGNIARLHPADDGADTVFVRLRIQSDRSQMKEMLFGYSDRIRIYVNGKRTYFGDAGWTVRDYRFLGTVGFFDSAGLDLKKGDNEILIAISETFGGWAFAGAMADRSGIQFAD
jgi:hypothetical protein